MSNSSALSGTQWFSASHQTLDRINLGENELTGQGGDSLRAAWKTLTGNFNNLLTATGNDETVQYGFQHTVNALRGVGDHNATRKYGWIDMPAYNANNSADNTVAADTLHNALTAAFTVLTHASSGIQLGSEKGTVYIQDDNISSFYNVDGDMGLGINYRSHANTAGHFRDLTVYDGKGNTVGKFHGAKQRLDIAAAVASGGYGDHIKLSVAGDSILSGITADTNTFVVNPNSNKVGIKTLAPTQELEVAGNISATETIHGKRLELSKDGLNTITGGIVTFAADDPDVTIAMTQAEPAGATEMSYTYNVTGVNRALFAYNRTTSAWYYNTFSNSGATQNRRFLITPSGAVVIGDSLSIQPNVAYDKNVLLDVQGTISGTSICATNMSVTNFTLSNNTTLGNDRTDVHVVDGNFSLSSATGGNNGLIFGKHGRANSMYAAQGGVIQSDVCMAAATFAMGGGGFTAADLRAEATQANGLFVGGGQMTLSGTNAKIKHMYNNDSDAQFSIVSKKNSTEYGLIIDPDDASLKLTNVDKFGVNLETLSNRLSEAGGVHVSGAAVFTTNGPLDTNGDGASGNALIVERQSPTNSATDGPRLVLSGDTMSGYSNIQSTSGGILFSSKATSGYHKAHFMFRDDGQAGVLDGVLGLKLYKDRGAVSGSYNTRFNDTWTWQLPRNTNMGFALSKVTGGGTNAMSGNLDYGITSNLPNLANTSGSSTPRAYGSLFYGALHPSNTDYGNAGFGVMEQTSTATSAAHCPVTVYAAVSHNASSNTNKPYNHPGDFHRDGAIDNYTQTNNSGNSLIANLYEADENSYFEIDNIRLPMAGLYSAWFNMRNETDSSASRVWLNADWQIYLKGQNIWKPICFYQCMSDHDGDSFTETHSKCVQGVFGVRTPQMAKLRLFIGTWKAIEHVITESILIQWVAPYDLQQNQVTEFQLDGSNAQSGSNRFPTYREFKMNKMLNTGGNASTFYTEQVMDENDT